MNKAFNNLKICILIINLICYLVLIKLFGTYDKKIIIYGLLLLPLIYITFRDLKNKIQNSKHYNVLFWIVEIIVIMIILRAIFDTNLNYLSIDPFYNFPMLYFLQNFYYILILYIGLIIYHKIECRNIKYKESKFSISSIIYLIINFILVIPTLNCINYSPITLLIFITIEVIVIALEIFSLIRNNHKKYDFPIYISFLFNLLAIIFIIVSLSI